MFYFENIPSLMFITKVTKEAQATINMISSQAATIDVGASASDAQTNCVTLVSEQFSDLDVC